MSFGSGRSQMFFKKGVLKTFAIFTKKHLSAFNNITVLEACSFTKKRLQHSYFPVSIAKF